MKADPFSKITLCIRCKHDFEDTQKYYIRPTSRKRNRVDTCDICQVRLGYDYKVTTKKYKGK